MNQERIEKEMHELEEKLDYQFKNINLLAEAMRSQKLPDDDRNKKEYSNEALAFLGDTIIKFLITKKVKGEKK